ncbi:MAG: acyl transferase [Saprospiraceae bacterium]|nr:acyl transferase [Saprospiraceae bacterium]
MGWERERSGIIERIINQDFLFEELALELFHYQSAYNKIYKEYLELIHVDATKIKNVVDIPFLPISFFKSHLVLTGEYIPKKVFTSSGTTYSVRSKHLIRDPELYYFISSFCFQFAFGQSVDQVVHVGLLPSYASNPDSSLLSMLDYFIKKGGGGYFHQEEGALVDFIVREQEKKIFLWGVSYALLNWKHHFPINDRLTLIETGGMKGMQAEITRAELHSEIKKNFHVRSVASEYGMTELLSQAYAIRDGLFTFSPTLRVYGRSISDPLSPEKENTTAALNMIDLANLDSCCFLATDDIGKVYSDQTFEVLGRLDNSDLRGCNLLLTGN